VLARTLQNLKVALLNESLARSYYSDFARRAEEEGLMQIVSLFKAAQAAEEIQSLNHLSLLQRQYPGALIKLAELKSITRTNHFVLGDNINGNPLRVPQELVIEKTQSTRQNLGNAIIREAFGFRKMYPEYANIAKQEDEVLVGASFYIVSKVEQVHANLFGKTLDVLVSGKKSGREFNYEYCKFCGNIAENMLPKACPTCGVPPAIRCSNCGRKNDSTSAYCLRCGRALMLETLWNDTRVRGYLSIFYFGEKLVGEKS